MRIYPEHNETMHIPKVFSTTTINIAPANRFRICQIVSASGSAYGATPCCSSATSPSTNASPFSMQSTSVSCKRCMLLIFSYENHLVSSFCSLSVTLFRRCFVNHICQQPLSPTTCHMANCRCSPAFVWSKPGIGIPNYIHCLKTLCHIQFARQNIWPTSFMIV